MTRYGTIVAGGGPAGLIAAGKAAEAGIKTLLLEKMNRPGLKLCITGKGRCNITNVAELHEFIDHFGKTGPFLRQAFSVFFTPELMSFFNNLGLKLITERGGRVFPGSSKASDVYNVLIKWVKKNGAEIRNSSKVDRLLIEDLAINGVVSNGRPIKCDAVILATGGASYPATGSTGDGYRLAEGAGHSIIPIRPHLVPLETSGDISAKMTGLNLRNINTCLIINGKRFKKYFGEVLFTDFGVTGPAILTLSGYAVDAMNNGGKAILSLDLKPALDENKLDARLLRDIASRSREPVNSFLRGLIPGKMVSVFTELAGISSDRTAGSIKAPERRRLKTLLKDFRLELTGHRPFSEAIITAGGVNTKEIYPKTMESRIIRGLYMAGEVLDLQADTGGYNLQASFSTGWVAGKSAADRLSP